MCLNNNKAKKRKTEKTKRIYLLNFLEKKKKFLLQIPMDRMIYVDATTVCGFAQG